MKVEKFPLVSILVPVYGVEKYIRRCVVSLFSQTYKNCEYIFVDDCTPDNSIKIITEILIEYPQCKNKVKILHHNINKGLAAARNTAVNAASGEFIMHVDSDDYIDVNTVEEAVTKSINDKSDVVIFGMKHIFGNNKYVVNPINNIPSDTKEYVRKLLNRECSVCVCGGLYKRALYINNGIEAIDGLNFGEDYSTKPRFIYFANKISYIDKPFYNYVHYNECAYTHSFKRSTITDLKNAVKVLCDFFSDKDNGWKDELRLTSLKTKIELLLGWGLHNGDRESWDQIRSLFLSSDYSNIQLSYKIILILASYNLPSVAKTYIKSAIAIKKFIK